LRIVRLLVLASSFLSMGGAIVGVCLVYVVSFISPPIVQRHFGFFIPSQPLTVTAYLDVLAVIVAGLLRGFVPALRTGSTAREPGQPAAAFPPLC
jgi:putative ABC transport system permease protein